MSLSRFFYPPCVRYQLNASYTITDDLHHRIVRVLHHHIGDLIILFDGNSYAYTAEIIEIRSKAVVLHIHERSCTLAEEPIFPIALLQCICHGKQLDFIIQKAVELGIQDIYPIISTFSPHRSTEWLQKKSHHWEGIAIAAAEQCERNRLPRVHPCVSLKEAISLFPIKKAWLCDHTLITPLIAHLPCPKLSPDDPLPIIIGPEGGFSPEENLLLTEKTQRVSLGPGILRVETAAISALAFMRLTYLKHYKALPTTTNHEPTHP